MEIGLKNSSIHINIWEPEGEPVGILQVIHGMGEHSKRYAEFAAYLNSEGYLVVATDHRGHGESVATAEEAGQVEDEFSALIDDEVELTKKLHRGYPELPVYILGHSMGSFIAQGYMKVSTVPVNGYILSGSGKPPYLKTKAGSILGEVIRVLRRNKRSPLMNKLLFAGYNRGIENPRAFDWLSRDRRVVEEYLSDPYCGFIYNSGFYAEFLNYLSESFNEEEFKHLNKNVPIYIFSGDRDPVGEYGAGVKKLYDFYRRSGYKNLRLKLYPEGRHEMLNEINKLEVFKDIIEYLKSLEKF